MQKTQETVGSLPELGRFFGRKRVNPLQYSCLENSMDRGAWWAAVHRVANSWKWLKQLSRHTRPQLPSILKICILSFSRSMLFLRWVLLGKGIQHQKIHFPKSISSHKDLGSIEFFITFCIIKILSFANQLFFSLFILAEDCISVVRTVIEKSKIISWVSM